MIKPSEWPTLIEVYQFCQEHTSAIRSC